MFSGVNALLLSGSAACGQVSHSPAASCRGSVDRPAMLAARLLTNARLEQPADQPGPSVNPSAMPLPRRRSRGSGEGAQRIVPQHWTLPAGSTSRSPERVTTEVTAGVGSPGAPKGPGPEAGQV